MLRVSTETMVESTLFPQRASTLRALAAEQSWGGGSGRSAFFCLFRPSSGRSHGQVLAERFQRLPVLALPFARQPDGPHQRLLRPRPEPGPQSAPPAAQLLLHGGQDQRLAAHLRRDAAANCARRGPHGDAFCSSLSLVCFQVLHGRSRTSTSVEKYRRLPRASSCSPALHVEYGTTPPR